MNKCQDILKLVRGNGFTLCLQVEARRTDGTAVEGFALQGDEVLKLLHNGASETKSYETLGNNVLVFFDGDDELGWYGLEMTGVYADEPWRWCVPRVFQIVETNERANLPGWTILAEDTYVIGCGITLLSAVVHADWDVNDPTDPSYIKNKPDLNEFALATDLLATNQRVTSLENNTVKTVRQVLDDTMKATARDNISAASVAQLNAKQDSLTAGDGISIENNVISATGGGGGLDEISNPLIVSLGSYDESTGAYTGSILPTTSDNAAWLYDIVPEIQEGLWDGTSDTTAYYIKVKFSVDGTVFYVPAKFVLAGSQSIWLYVSVDGVYISIFFQTGANNSASVTAYKLSHLVATEENKFYDTGIYLDELVPNLTASTIEKLSALRSSSAEDKIILIRGSRLWSAAGTYAVATVTSWGSSFDFFVNNDGTNIHVQGDGMDNWTCTRTTPEASSNKKNSITGNESSTAYYPSTKAVADYVSGIVGDINTILDEINGEVI